MEKAIFLRGKPLSTSMILEEDLDSMPPLNHALAGEETLDFRKHIPIRSGSIRSKASGCFLSAKGKPPTPSVRFLA